MYLVMSNVVNNTSMNPITWPSAREWWQSLRWVLLIMTFIIILTVAGSFVPYEEVVAKGHPWLPIAQCPGCILCGMTRSFCAMSAGRWAKAFNWNHGGPLLYVGGWVWIACALVLGFRHVRRHVSLNATACALARYLSAGRSQ